jgi:hypothetical protein
MRDYGAANHWARYVGQFVLRKGGWWATLDSNQ